MICNAGRFALTALMIGTMTGTLAGQTPQTVDLVSRVHPSQVSDTGSISEPRSGSSTFPHGATLPSISDDGRYVVFDSQAPNLVPGQKDVNSRRDVFLKDLLTGTTTLVSRSMASPAMTGNGGSIEAAISGDGRFIAFASRATDH